MKTKTRKQPVARSAKRPAESGVGTRPGRHAGPKDKDLETIHNEVTAAPERQHLEEWVSVDCPYCGEGIDIHVTSEQDGQTLYEDCGVCCRPCSVHVHIEDDEFQVEAHRS